MSKSTRPRTGVIAWTDLTVRDAERVRDFYSQVVGWRSSEVSMGDYSDFNMMAPGDDSPVAGICHKRGTNAGLPSQWLVYMVVEDLDRSTTRCTELGGRILVAPKKMGGQGAYCVIEDPAGAVAALFELPREEGE